MTKPTIRTLRMDRLLHHFALLKKSAYVVDVYQSLEVW